MAEEIKAVEKSAESPSPHRGEGTAPAQAQQQAIEPAKSVDETAPVQTLDTSKKTTGEKYYDRLKFATGEVFILGITAVLAYVARCGKPSYGGIPNYLQRLQHWVAGDLLTRKIPIRKWEIGKIVAASWGSMMVTSHGGNAFAPFMKWFEDGKGRLVTYFNRRFGKPGELEAGQARLQGEPKENWGDVIKGRIVGMSTVWASFCTAMILAGKDKGVYRFDKFEDWVGKKLAWFTKEGKEIANLSLRDRLDHKHANKTYEFGRILALDVFATTASLIIWNAVSRISAKKHNSHKKPSPENTSETPQAPALVSTTSAALKVTEPAEQNDRRRNHAENLTPRETHAEALVTERMGSEAAVSQAMG